jgi:hypothetical protein
MLSWRAIQGLGSAILAPSTLALLQTRNSMRQRRPSNSRELGCRIAFRSIRTWKRLRDLDGDPPESLAIALDRFWVIK